MRYTNPIFAGYFADPFVWRTGEEYFAVGTGPAEAEGAAAGERGVFPVLRSRDLVHWDRLGHALRRPADLDANAFWAPEVAFADGRFHLYYSAGHGDRDHRLFVATSDSPAGPYGDPLALTELSEVPFAIDPHPFRDRDGRFYLFHARDFLDSQPGSARPGTALVVHELESMTRLARKGRTVLRARFDWQRFAANRRMYGRVFDWHTLEGPFVIEHRGLYYCLYSGGCWQDESYGVDYAVASHVLGPYDDSGAEAGPRVLRTVPGHVRGPGHCSVVTAADGRTPLVVYHAWDEGMTTRSMRVDELRFGPDGLRSSGPSWRPRELPSREPAARETT